MSYTAKAFVARVLFVVAFFSLLVSISNTIPAPAARSVVKVKTPLVFAVPKISYNTLVDNILPPKPQAVKEDSDEVTYVQTITDRYNVDDEFAREVVQLAHKYSDTVFPTAEDIIAIIGIESGFNPKARSGLKYDPAVGLTQVRPRVWKKLVEGHNIHDIENQIRFCAEILARYYRRTHSRDGAVMAYNVGITAYKQGQRNHRYLRKYKRELALYQ